MIRWKGLIAFAIVLGIIAIFVLFFLDGILKTVIENQATALVGAKVEIGDLSLKLLGLRIEITDLQITNPDNPMRNALQVGSLAFDLAAAPLLKKKVIIEQMAVKNLAFDTPRKRSGALPVRLRQKVEGSDRGPEVTRRIKDCLLPDLSKIMEPIKTTPEELLKGFDLGSISFLAEYRKQVAQAKERWQNRLASLPDKESIQKEVKALQDIKDLRPRDPTQIPAYMEKVADIQQRLSDTLKNLAEAQKQFEVDIENLKGSLKEVQKLKDQDVRSLMSKIGIEIPTSSDLICVLFGKEMALRADRYLSWYRKMKAFVPAGKPGGKRETPIQRPRLKGTDVIFPVTRGYPDFLLVLAEFSMKPGGLVGGGGFSFDRLSGELRGLTTQPSVYGKPATFKIEGALSGSLARYVAVSGELDHRAEPVSDLLRIKVDGLNVEKLAISGADAPLRLVAGIINLSGHLRVKGESLDGEVAADVIQPKFAIRKEAAIIADILKGMPSFDVMLKIGGTVDQPSLSLSSSASRVLESAIQNLVQSRLKGLQQALKNAIETRLEKDMKEVNLETNSLEKMISGELAGRIGVASSVLKTAPKEKVPVFPLFR